MSVGSVNKETGGRIPAAGNYLDKVGTLASLHTDAKTNAVSAINEVADAVSAISDGQSIDSFGDVETALNGKQDTLTFDDVPTANSDNPVKSGGVKSAIDTAVASAYHHAGTKTCAELVAGLLVAANEGNVYNMTDSGTTTADFIEGAGQPIKAGDNVGIAKISDGVYKFDLLSGFVDTTNFVQKSSTAGLLKNDGTVNDEIEGDVESLKSGLTNLDNEVNGDATTYPYADVITIEDAVPSNLADCSVKIEPVQDLHGQSAPYVGGAGKALFPIKEITQNTGGVDVTTIKDGAGNILGYNLNGTATQTIDIWMKDANIMTQNLPAGVSRYFYTGLTSEIENFQFVVSPGYWAYKTDKTASEEIQNVYINIQSGCVLNNVKVYPMICLASETDKSFAPYTNICPISGHTEVDVQRDGVNIADPSKLYIFNNNTYVATSNFNTVGAYDVEPNTEYRLLSGKSGGGDKTIKFWDAEGNFISSPNSTVFTTPNNCAKISFYWQLPSAVQTVEEAEMMLCLSQYTSFEPFKGKTYTIALGDTIYGGTVDFDSGVMTVMRKGVDLGLLDFTYDESQRFTTVVSDMKSASIREAHFITSCYLTIDDGRPYSQVPDFSAYAGWNGAAMSLSLHDSRYSDAATYKTAITGQTICYELATPTTIQLTPQQIQLLKGQNTLTASTGQISVTVNGVSGSIGAVQEQVNELAEDVAELTDGQDVTYNLCDNVTVATGRDIFYKKGKTLYISLHCASSSAVNNLITLSGITPVKDYYYLNVTPMSGTICYARLNKNNMTIQIYVMSDNSAPSADQFLITGAIPLV